jgi:hypothetical protein
MICNAEGLEIVDAPKDFAMKGPCPHCLHEVWPSGLAFKVGEEKMNAETAGVVVCNECLKPLIFYEPGKYRRVSRELLRRLPRFTQRWIKIEQEMQAQLKRQIN